MKNALLSRLGGVFANEANLAILSRLLSENLRPLRRYYITAALAMVGVAAATALMAFMIEFIVDALTLYEDRARILMVSFAVMATFVFRGVATYIQEISLARAGNRIVARQQSQLFAKIVQNGRGFFAERESSDILLRLTNGARAARQIIDLVVTVMVRDLLVLIGLLGVMIYQQPFLSLIVFVVVPVVMFSVRALVKRIQDITRTETASLSEILRVLQETSRGIEVVKVFSLEGHMKSRMDSAVGIVENRANSIARLRALSSPVMDTIAGFVIAGMVALAAFDAFAAQGTTPGQLISFISAALLSYEPAKRLARMRVQLEAPMSRVRMMLEVLDFERGVEEVPGAEPLANPDGEVRLNKVTFGYIEDAAVLDQLDLVFEPGKMTALVGPSGGGKSTILNLLMRFYDPTSGTVTIGGQDLRMVSLSSLLERIAYVGQDTFLFSTTVRDNIRVGRPDASDHEIEVAAMNANAHEFIAALPNGYDTEVGENGAFLSGGQRQRLAIARAMLKDATILLLDEPTSALDAEAEARVKEALRRLAENRTTIVIAHRLSTVLDAEKIYVISDGKLVESGTFRDLMDRDGVFRELFEKQSEFSEKPPTEE